MPRAGLTPEIVVAEAAKVADASGFEGLTLATVAHRFGVAVPSLYKHIDGLDALRREVALQGFNGLGEALATEDRGDGGIRSLAHAYRNFARSHPGLYAATLRAPDPDDDEATAASARALDVVLRVLSGYGLSGDDAIDAARTLRAALHGFLHLESLGGFGLPRDVDRSFARLVEILDSALRGGNP